MAITQVGSTLTGLITTGAGTITPSLPAGLAADDVVIVITCFDEAAAGDGLAADTSYTIYGATNVSPDNFWGYKRMGATPDTTVTLGQNASAIGTYIIQAWRGVDTVDILDVAKPNATTGNDNTIECPSITPNTSGALVVAIAMLDDDDTTVSSYPTDYSATATINTGQASTTVGNTIAIANKTWTTGTETPVFTFGSSDAWRGEIIALKPYVPPATTTTTTIAATTTTTTEAPVSRRVFIVV